jgi:uncharacterized damage-inducible protein DinB
MDLGLVEMLRYNRWANEILLEACRTLADEHLDAALPAISGTVRELVIHTVGGQQTFALRTKGRQHEGELHRRSAWPGWDTVLEIARTSSDELIAIAESLGRGRPPIHW